MIVDQQTRRRDTKAGLTALDQDRACLGYVLYSPMNGTGDVDTASRDYRLTVLSDQ